MKKIFAIGVMAVMALAAAGQVRAQSDPAIGTWKANIAKSKYNARPAPKSDVRTYAMQGAEVKLAVTGVAAAGSLVEWGYTARLDGKDNPITGNGPAGGDSIAVTRASSHMVRTTLKKGGKVVETATRVVSADGKTMTITAFNAGSDRTPISVVVYDKQ